jgi:hypothetical protein
MSTVQQEYRYAFKLKSGSHYDFKRKLNIEAGEIYHTDTDMIKLHGKNRWELVSEGEESIDSLRNKIKQLESRLPQAQPVAKDQDDLDAKSIKDLRTMAAEMSPPVDLTTCTGKAEIINAIRQAMDAA